MHVLIVSNLFPNPVETLRGNFVAEMTRELNKKIKVSVLNPLPWFPKISFLDGKTSYFKFARVPRTFEIFNLKISSPKYLAIPKMGFLQSLFIFIRLLPEIWNLHRQERIDIVNAHWVFPDGVGVSWICWFLRIPCLLSARGCDVNLYSKFILRRQQIKSALKIANKITVMSNDQKKTVQTLGVSKSKIKTIYNGIDQVNFKIRDKVLCRQSLGLELKETIILVVAQLVEVKGLDYLLEAIHILKAKGSFRDKRLIIIGEGMLRAKLIRKCNELNLLDRVSFLGKKTRSELPIWYGACDIFCLPSIREGCPNVVLESLASGRPVVASNVGGVPELVCQINGILFHSKNTVALVEALEKAQKKVWDEHLIRLSVKDFTWEKTANKFLESFEQILLER